MAKIAVEIARSPMKEQNAIAIGIAEQFRVWLLHVPLPEGEVGVECHNAGRRRT
jgi:hypothetical protein